MLAEISRSGVLFTSERMNNLYLNHLCANKHDCQRNICRNHASCAGHKRCILLGECSRRRTEEALTDIVRPLRPCWLPGVSVSWS